MYWNGGEREQLRSEYLQKREVVKKKRKERKNKKAEEGKYNTVLENWTQRRSWLRLFCLRIRVRRINADDDYKVK